MDYRKKRVLFVDDDHAITATIKLLLEQEGQFHVWTENKSKRGIMAAKMFRPDVILLDINMPHPDGAEIATELKRIDALKDVPIVFFTGLADSRRSVTGDSNERILAKTTELPVLMRCLEEAITENEMLRSREMCAA